MTNGRWTSGTKPRSAQATGTSAAIPNFGKLIWPTAAFWCLGSTEFGLSKKNRNPLQILLARGGKPVQSHLSQVRYERRWHTIEAQIPTSDLSVRGPEGVFRPSFPRNPFSPGLRTAL